jgi:stage II sporulation protein GA (sporulation sigma-E factor processing peptidase)
MLYNKGNTAQRLVCSKAVRRSLCGVAYRTGRREAVQTTVYLDVLLVFNLYVNYILIRMTASLTHSHLSTGRALAASAVGSLCTLMILLPTLPLFLSLLCKAGSAAVLCAVAFGWHNRIRLCWSCLCFLGMSLVMAGLLMALALCSNTRVLYANACWYLDISLFRLVLFTAAAYVLLGVVQRFHDRTHATEGEYRVLVRHGSITVQMEGLADTGNSLVDFLTGLPVIICGGEKMETAAKQIRCRPLPYTTVSGSGILPVFRPDEVVIYASHSGTAKSVDALIGVSSGENGRAIFNPKLLHF